MDAGVKACVDARLDMFTKYMQAPPQLQPQIDAFNAKVIALGEQSADYASFEAAFISSGLSDEFNALIPQCTAKPVEYSPEIQAQMQQIQEEMHEEYVADMKQKLVDDTIETAELHTRSAATTLRRRAMIETGTFDEYTRMSNRIGYAKRGAGMLKGLFGKNKNQDEDETLDE